MNDAELDRKIAHLEKTHPMEHPGIRAGTLLNILIELRGLRKMTNDPETAKRIAIDYLGRRETTFRDAPSSFSFYPVR